jgi:hypothetical protein
LVEMFDHHDFEWNDLSGKIEPELLLQIRDQL